MADGADTADRFRVNKRELARILRCSLPTVDAMMGRYQDFPVEQAGTVGRPYLFDAEAVVEFLKRKREEEAAEEAKRGSFFEQFSLPIDEVAPEGAAQLSPSQRAQLAQARIREQDLAIKAGFLVQTSEVRRCIMQLLTSLGRMLDALPDQVARAHNLPDATARAMRSTIDEHRRRCVRELDEFFAAQEAAENPPGGEVVEIDGFANQGFEDGDL